MALAGLLGDELQDLGESFNDLLARLHEAFERQRRFTGDASHQLRTPLAAMLGQVDVALRRDRPGEDYRRVLTLVRDKTLHLSQIVEMLLFLARADAEAETPGSEEVDLAAWIKSVELSAQRAGLLLCGDLKVAMTRMRAETRAIAELGLEQRRADLLAFCASDKLGRARGLLGLDARASNAPPSSQRQVG